MSKDNKRIGMKMLVMCWFLYALVISKHKLAPFRDRAHDANAISTVEVEEVTGRGRHHHYDELNRYDQLDFPVQEGLQKFPKS